MLHSKFLNFFDERSIFFVAVMNFAPVGAYDGENFNLIITHSKDLL